MKTIHPMQPVVWDGHGVIRFKQNRIVRWMLEQGKEGAKFDLNTIASAFSGPSFREDYAQLMQLIGYSISGFGDLTGVPKRIVTAADSEAEQLLARKRKGGA